MNDPLDHTFLDKLTSNTLTVNEAIGAFQLALQGVASVAARGTVSAADIFGHCEFDEHVELAVRIGLLHALCEPFFGIPGDGTWAQGVSELGKHAAVELARVFEAEQSRNFAAFATLTAKLA